MIEWKRCREDDPERRKHRPAGWPDASPTRVYERFASVALPIVCEVVVEPAEERGEWTARFRYHSSGAKGRAREVAEAKEQALDAAETMLAQALDGLEEARIGKVATAAALEAEAAG
jgi:hypothetical protein